MKYLSKFLMFVAVFFVMPDLFASTIIQIGTDIDLNEAFKDVATFTGTFVLIVDFLKNTLPNVFKPPFLTWFSWLLPIALGIGAFFFGFGLFAEVGSWWMAGLVGLSVSVSSFAVQYIGILNIILQLLKIDLPARRKQIRSKSS